MDKLSINRCKISEPSTVPMAKEMFHIHSTSHFQLPESPAMLVPFLSSPKKVFVFGQNKRPSKKERWFVFFWKPFRTKNYQVWGCEHCHEQKFAHFCESHPATKIPWFLTFFWGEFYGLNVFFCLRGFVASPRCGYQGCGALQDTSEVGHQQLDDVTIRLMGTTTSQKPTVCYSPDVYWVVLAFFSPQIWGNDMKWSNLTN